MRSQICKSCCPNGGAIFDKVCDDGKAVAVCRNCGAKKPVRRKKDNLTDEKRAKFDSMISRFLAA